MAGEAHRNVNDIRDDLRDFRQATTSIINAIRHDLVDMRTDVGNRLDVLDSGQQQIMNLLNILTDRAHRQRVTHHGPEE